MKTVSIQTNYNQKLSCDCIVHVSLAPPHPVPESKLGQEYEITVADKSHPPVKAQLLFFMRFKLGTAVDVFTLPSHGMDAAEFIEWYKTNNPGVTYGTEMAVYYYKRA